MQEPFSINHWNRCRLKNYLHKAGEQQKQRRHRGEADGGAEFVRVPGETGGDRIRTELNQTEEKSVGISSRCRTLRDQCASLHIKCTCVYISQEENESMRHLRSHAADVQTE